MDVIREINKRLRFLLIHFWITKKSLIRLKGKNACPDVYKCICRIELSNIWFCLLFFVLFNFSFAWYVLFPVWTSIQWFVFCCWNYCNFFNFCIEQLLFGSYNWQLYFILLCLLIKFNKKDMKYSYRINVQKIKNFSRLNPY